MVLTALAPMVSMMDSTTDSGESHLTPQSAELGERIVSESGARAPCPSTQNDGGTSGDAAGGVADGALELRIIGHATPVTFLSPYT